MGENFHFFVFSLVKGEKETVSDGGLCIRLTDSESDSEEKGEVSSDDEGFLLGIGEK